MIECVRRQIVSRLPSMVRPACRAGGLVGWALALVLEIASKVGWKGRLLLSMLAVTARGPNRESRSRAPRALGSRRRVSRAPAPPRRRLLRPRVAARLASALRSPRASSRLVACPISADPKEAAPLVGGGGVRVEREPRISSCTCYTCYCAPPRPTSWRGRRRLV
jgi:hypothetical protein